MHGTWAARSLATQAVQAKLQRLASQHLATSATHLFNHGLGTYSKTWSVSRDGTPYGHQDIPQRRQGRIARLRLWFFGAIKPIISWRHDD